MDTTKMPAYTATMEYRLFNWKPGTLIIPCTRLRISGDTTS